MTKGIKAVVLAMGLVTAIGFSTHVFAGKGYGRGYGGPEDGQRGWNCPGYGPSAGLSDEEKAKLDTERQAFWDSTADLRRDIRQKKLELQIELNKSEIDGAKARAIQKELSDLRAQLDQKRLDHRMRIKEIDPDLGGGMGRFYGRGPGRFDDRGMDRRGGCW